MKWFTLLTGKIEKATKGSAAFDLFATEDVELGDYPTAVPTGVTTTFSKDLVAIIKEKSGPALKGVEIKAGVIDSDFSLEWKVVMRYAGDNTPGDSKPFKIKAGQKIAQVLLVDIPEVEFNGDGIKFLDTVREGGFGSTGLT